MARVLVGGISPEGEYILQQYLNAFMPDAEIEPIKAIGVRGMLNRQGKQADTVLIILEDSLYQKCLDNCADVLQMPKVHKYTTDEKLTEFLISKFGKLDVDSSNVGYEDKEPDNIPPDVLMRQNSVNTVADEDNFSLGITESDEDYTENTSNADIERYESEIVELKGKLESLQMINTNLQAQLQEEQEGNEVSELVAKINEMQATIDKQKEQIQNGSETDYEALGKVARAEQIIKDVDNLKADLKKAREDNAVLVHDKSELDKTIQGLNTKLEEVNNQIETLKTQITEKETEISTLQSEVDEKDNQLVQNEATIQGKTSELTVLQEKADKLDSLNADLVGLKKELQEKDIELGDLKIDYDKKIEELKELNSQISELKTNLSNKDNEITELNTKLANLSQSGAETSEQVESLTNQINSLNSELSSLKEEVTSKDNEITELQNNISQMETLHQQELDEAQQKLEDISGLDTELDTLKEKCSSLQTTNSSLDSMITELKEAVKTKDEAIKQLEENMMIKDEEKSVQSSQLDKIIAEKQELEEQVVSVKEEQIHLQGTIEELNNNIQTLETQHKSELAEKDKMYSELEQEKAKSDNKITQLQSSLIDSQADAESISRLENDLLEERRKSARLNSELEVMKKSEGSGKSAELRLEIARLNEELKKAKTESVNSGEASKLKDELSEERAKAAELEMLVAEKEEQLAEYSDGVFGQIANLAMPKVAYDVDLGIKNNFLSDHIYCYASGSEESSSILFSTIRKSCNANPNARIIILDLTTDSTIDRDFGAQTVKSPITWITGSENFTSFLADTKFKNVKILSTALAYMNDLFLLNIDWGKRIEELKSFADAVIINVGCLNNLVSKILFNSFSRVMRSHIIVKASPINIRATILNITGYSSISENVTVDCINFDKQSQGMYQRLAQKCKATIVKDSDIIAL